VSTYDEINKLFACYRRSAAPPPPRFVFAVLMIFRNTKTGRCDPSIATLRAVTGYGRATVLRVLDELKRCGALTTTRRRRRSSQYTLHPLALEVSLWDFKAAGKKSRSGLKKSHSEPQEVSERDPEQGKEQGKEQGTEQGTPADAPAAHRRVAAHRVASRSSQEDAPDPRVAVLLRLFCQTHESTLGTKYLCAGRRDAVALKRALATYDEATIRMSLAAFFRDRTSRLRYGAKVTQFVERIGTLAAAPDPKHHSGSPRTAGNLEAIARGLGLRR
jgi:hypothetical protein